MKRTNAAILLASLGLAGLPAAPVAAQTRVVVPIIIQAPRAGAPRSAATPSVQVTTRTTSPQPGVTTTRITVQDTTGRLLGVSPASRTMATVPGGMPSTQVTTRTTSPQPGVTTTRITVQDTTGRLLGVSPAPRAVPTSTSSVRITVDRESASVGTDPAAQTRVTAEDFSGAGRPQGLLAPLTFQAGSGARQTVTITSDAPIDAPIVILGP